MKGKDWRLVWAVGAAVVSGCGGGTRIVTVVNSDADGSSEYWVCDHKARECRGEREGDLDPKGFQHRMRVVAPPAECPDGVHRMDIVVDRTEVVRVRYECAHGRQPGSNRRHRDGALTMVDLPHTRSQTIDWINLHGTHRQRGVTRILPIASQADDAIDRWRRVGQIFRAVVKHAFDTDQPLRPDGSRWSLSAIGKPHKLALSLAAHDVAHAVPESWRSAAYRTELEGTERTPMLVSGSMKIHRLNRVLAMSELALPTSGASDGQTIAGACATGTNGAAVRFGAVHDALRAVHLMVGPDKSVLVQPKGRPLLAQAAPSLSHWLDIETESIS